ncbi:MBL fold metallo-hydrolase [Microbacterium sp. NPDC096154]|uniref:MBL fold metallo-hydrolase n=1 Tax=Microbacterium sp. NPDC096154 TaxID=3155549 RepID=UPI0033170C4A
MGAVNCYVVRTGRDVVLIDPGWSSEVARTALDRHLVNLGLTYRAIDLILVTHHHYDHFSQAVDLRAQFDIPIAVGHGEQHSLRASLGEGSGYHAQNERLRRWGAVDLAEEAAAYRSTEREGSLPTGLADRWIEEGAIIGGIRALASPGHTRGHITFVLDEPRVAFTGDHLLTHIVSGTGIERVPAEFPVREQLASLRRTARDLEGYALAPAHGWVEPDVADRSVEVIAHHERRIAELREAVHAAGSCTALQIAESRTWTRRSLRFAEVGLLRRVAAISEIGMHLDELVARGELARISSARGFVYRAA